jgi:hypothetical protein
MAAKKPQIQLITWLDAASHDAIEPDTPVDSGLARLQTTGFLIGESDTTVVLGMEVGAEDVAPGRFRFTIPKAAIISRLDLRVPMAAKVQGHKKGAP